MKIVFCFIVTLTLLNANLGYIKLDNNEKTETILQIATSNNKKIIIKATSDDCYFCEKMDKEVFELEEVRNKINNNFIMVEVDVTSVLLPFNLNKVYDGMTPTFFMLDGKGNLQNQYPGSWTKKDFLLILDENR